MLKPLTTGHATIIRGDARRLPLPDNSVDLVVTSPPYFALRSYTDGGEHYDGQIGAESNPNEFVSALLDVTRECARVLKPTGSIWVNLGDKYSDRAGPAWAGSSDRLTGRPTKPRRASSTSMAPRKSLLGLPWRYALGCIDELRLILRAEVVWSKPNGLPESVTDRVRRSHEQWFHFTLEPRYYSTVDEIREPHAPVSIRRAAPHRSPAGRRATDIYAGQPGQTLALDQSLHDLGRLPGSVWEVATEPLKVPPHIEHARCCAGAQRPDCEAGNDHFAAFPTEWPKKLVTGWCPPDGVVLDPFGGTGTTAMVAKALGRHGVSVDMSADYCRLAEWRTNDRDQLAKVLGIPKTTRPHDDEQSLLDLLTGGVA
jgi:DNA modification methylase